MLLAVVLSSAVGALLWLVAEPLVAMDTDSRRASGSRQPAALHCHLPVFRRPADSGQPCLRGYRITFVPMLVQTFCFWGVGRGGDWWLCYRGPPMGGEGFWLASVISLVLAAALLLPMLS